MPDQYNLETSPATTDISELENQPPSVSPSLSSSLSPSLSTSLPIHNGINGIRQQIHRNSQLPMKIKQELTDETSKYQSHDRRCDTNNNNSNKNNKTKVAKQILTVIRNDDYEEFLIILRSKPDLNVFINGQTALHYCLLFGRDVSWCRQLVLNGANPNLSNHDGWHPLHLAASFGHNEILSYLINCNTNKGVNSDVL